MTAEPHQKVRATHLKRDAYLYIRQSTVRQVFETRESTARQYALRQRAVALFSNTWRRGWPRGVLARQLLLHGPRVGARIKSASPMRSMSTSCMC